jgi:hypothetical protein
LRRTVESIVASNEIGYLGGMMVAYASRDIEPSTVNDCFGSSVLVAANVGYRAEKRVDEGRLGVDSVEKVRVAAVLKH